jgi:transposase-like protein
VSDASENPTSPLVTGVDARRLASHLFRTTDLGVAAIASQVGVSRQTLYRWLRQDNVSFGPNTQNHPAAPIGQDAIRTSEDIAELRGQLSVLIAQVGRLEGLVEALVGGPRHQAV